jgi:Leucine-rich repeat (LRR) protein
MTSVKKDLKKCFDNSPNQEVYCNFTSIGLNYVCYLQNVLLGEGEKIFITGNHQPEKSDSDVSSVIFIESKLHGIPSEIFEKFENLKELNVESTGLEELNHLGNCSFLESFKAPLNNIVKLSDETFKDCKNLRTVDLQSNKIEKLEKTVFKHNEKLWEVNLSRNVINGIEPCGFLGNQPELQSVNLLGNKCVDKNVDVANEKLEKILVNCYRSWYLTMKAAEDLLNNQ